MTNAHRFLALWLVAAVLLAPLHGLLPGVGSGLITAGVGGAFLYGGRHKPDHGLRNAFVAVLLFTAMLWAGALAT